MKEEMNGRKAKSLTVKRGEGEVNGKRYRGVKERGESKMAEKNRFDSIGEREGEGERWERKAGRKQKGE